MSTENPMAKLAKWISNFQAHEQKLIGEIEELRAEIERVTDDLTKRLRQREHNLEATQTWLSQLSELLSKMEGTNQASLEILEREEDPDFKTKQGTHFERVESYFYSIKNEPQTIVEIERATGISRTSLSSVLYRTHADKFDSGYKPQKKGKVWFLKSIDEARMRRGEPTPEWEDPFADAMKTDDEIPF